MIERHRLWGCSLRCDVLSWALVLTPRRKHLGGFSSLQTLATILSRLLGVVWALSALETCRALLKGVFYFRVEGGWAKSPFLQGVAVLQGSPYPVSRMVAVSQGCPYSLELKAL